MKINHIIIRNNNKYIFKKLNYDIFYSPFRLGFFQKTIGYSIYIANINWQNIDGQKQKNTLAKAVINVF